MDFKHIVAAADESEAGRQAVRAAVALGVAARASVTVMRALPTSRAVVGALAIDSACDPAFVEDAARLRAWVEADLPAVEDSPRVSYGVTYGHPGVEIGRFAELHGADLVVVGTEVALAHRPAADGRHRRRGRAPKHHPLPLRERGGRPATPHSGGRRRNRAG